MTYYIDNYYSEYYEGEWLNNLKHGLGKYVFNTGEIYEGIFANDLYHG